jgi:hypothetical protein
LSPLARSTTASAPRISPPGARDEIVAPSSAAGDRADEQGRRHGELEIAEQQVTDRRRRDQGHSLDEVGADEIVGAQHRIERQERDDDQ